MATPDISLKLAERLSAVVNESFESGEMLEKVTPVTAELLKFWFTEPYIDERTINFHEGQRQSILNVIYLHEIARIERVIDIYATIAPDLLPEVDMTALAKEKYSIPKYAIKMATGTGKTWVMYALMLWQILNSRHEDEPSGRFTSRFLVVAPGLVVYDRLLDAFMGRLKQGTNERDPFTNDFQRNQDLFIPPAYRHEVFSFIQANVVSKEEGIGRKVTGEGLIALTNWHLFMQGEDVDTEEDSTSAIISDILPVRPGLTGGNTLDTLDRQYLRGNELEYLASLPDLMVINDEAHHIHENKVAGEIQEVEWQKGLSYIAQHKKTFVQLDFSATPFDTIGTGKKKVHHYFPHIVVDFDLKRAMQQGLVKTLLLDKRQELTELENLDYNAVRDGRKVISLSDGQRLMLRAGLKKLHTLEQGFMKIDETKHPKMLVMCEDTNVSPFVEEFLREEGLNDDDILRIDSSTQGEVKDAEWMRIKERLFNVDQYATPKVIISVLMLREGFDVNNICVIVPLRSTESSILLEQTIGRGLRQMWRDPQYDEEKRENRNRILVRKEPPLSYIDMLSIIEHPKFEQFYKDLLSSGLAGTDASDLSNTSVTGDIIRVGLKDDYEQYDMFWPFVIREAEEEIKTSSIDIDLLAPFSAFTLDYLRQFLATSGEVFISQAVMAETQFGKYEVKADLFTASSYNQYLQKLLNIVLNRRYKHKNLPVIQINQLEIISAIDIYIRTRLFSQPFNPFSGNDWKILLAKDGIVTQHIVKEISIAVHRMQEDIMTTEAEVEKIWFSSVPHLRIRESYSLELQKVIYEKMGYPSNRGGFEKDMSLFLDKDVDVQRFLKISESQHAFATIFYLREDGLLASYHPDFIVCTKEKIFILETKSNAQIKDANVRHKRIASIEWCKKINQLKAEDRMNREWEYLLLSEDNFYGYCSSNATFMDIARLSQVSLSALTGDLFA